jgi:hypothetical protein
MIFCNPAKAQNKDAVAIRILRLFRIPLASHCANSPIKIEIEISAITIDGEWSPSTSARVTSPTGSRNMNSHEVIAHSNPSASAMNSFISIIGSADLSGPDYRVILRLAMVGVKARRGALPQLPREQNPRNFFLLKLI